MIKLTLNYLVLAYRRCYDDGYDFSLFMDNLKINMMMKYRIDKINTEVIKNILIRFILN